MILKRLELLGFKSFAEKTVVEFGPGVTAVVGPNGSGKSNLADAIRWVLGEGSARALRGGRMEDVIFGGAAERRPLPLAEVSLVLDNSDGMLPIAYNEVTVARSVDRAGTVTYFINRAPCRLRDVQQLFFGTGLGKAAYAFVGQGEVDAMLDARPEDRRAAVEEAAGVTRQRARLAEASRRLSAAEQAVVRLEDILAERRRALGPLERQAERTRRHTEVSGELRRLGLSLWSREYASLEERLRGALSAGAAGRRRLEALAQARAALAAQELAADAAAAEARRRLTEAHTILGAAAARRERALQAVALAEGLAHGLTTEEKRLRAQLDQYEERVRRWAAEDAKAAERRVEREQEEAAARRSLGAAEAEGAVAAQERADRATELQQVQAELAAVRAERRSIAEGAAAEEVAAASEEAAAAAAARAAAEESLAGGRTRLAALRARREALRDELQAARSRAATLRETAGDGYGQGPRNVLAWRLAGILGSVASLIEVPDELRTAVAAALGASAQWLVAMDAQAVEAAIGELKRRHGGRATFLPLDALRTTPPPAGLEREPGAVGWAVALIGCADAVRPAVEHVLGRVLVAQDLTRARSLARASGFKVRLVTLEGEIVHPGGAMTGGTAERSGQTLVGRASELRRLAQRIEVVDSELAGLEQAIKATSQEVDAAEAAVRETGRKAAAAEALARRRPVDVARGAWLSERERELAQAAQAAVAMLGAAERREAAARKQQAACGAQLARIEEEGRGGAAWGQRLAAERAAVETSRGEINATLATVTRERAQRTAEAAEARALAEALALEVSACQGREADLKAAEVAAGAARADLDAQRRRLEADREAAETELRRAEVEQARVEAARSALAERIAEEYDLTLDQLSEVPSAERPGVARDRVAELRRELAAIGPVDPDAARVLEREARAVTTLAGQLDDLARARGTLAAWIERLEVRLERRYAETLATVRKHLQATFTRLFGGGRADLIPVDQGLELVAQPPGKQIGSLLPLSGGERTLVAIALLFALLFVRPAAFCVLDEVEAALDDANVGRFASFLNEMGSATQFLVITHQKGTMEVADRLVGVAMGSAGVSSLLSVRLADAVGRQTG